MEDNYREVKKAEPCLKLIHMDQVEVEEIEWLFYPFIPYGKVTIIQGDPGEGKTTVVLQIIAKLTKGEAILSETSEGKSEEAGVEPINVIYQTAEDGLGDTIKPRLLAAGADCSRVLVIDDQDQPLTMVDARLEEAIIQTKARLVVLDPIQGFLGAGVDMHRANEIRPLMKRISVLAEKYQCAIILIGHMNKNSNGKSSYRGLGSIDFQAAARSVLIVGRVKDEPEIRVMVMRENEIEWDQKGTHEQHLSVLDYKKKVREQEVEELTEHKNLLEHDLHDISECVDEIQKEKAQAEKERDAVIKKTEVLEKRFSALNSKAGLVDSHAREYGYYPEEWLPEAGTLESAKSYRKRIFPLVKKVANMIQALYSKYLDLKNKNQKLSDRNIDLENRVDRLREEISVIKKENVALLNVAYDMDRVVAVLGENKVKEAIEVAKHLEQVNAKQKGKKRRTDREGR